MKHEAHRPVRGALILQLCALVAAVGCASGEPPGGSDAGGGRDGGDGAVAMRDAGVTPCEADSDCDDGDACNGVETCSSGSVCVAGAPVSCDDAVGCTVDACDAATGSCVHNPDDTRCAVDLVCDPVDDCAAPLPCTSDSDCDDGVFCNGLEACDTGFGCRNGVAPTCEDAFDCTVGVCDATTDACMQTNTDSRCSDGAACNGVETCDPTDAAADGNGCVPSTPPVCDDGVDCTMDFCDEAAGGCTSTPDDAFCSDGVFCNGPEVCDAVAGCMPGTSPSCADAVGCTTGSCDATTDACVQVGNDSMCQDGMVCNGSERCDITGTTPGTGCVAGAPLDCSDGLACTTDGCTEPGTCTHGGSDADGDGYTAVGCGTGNDCNDLSGAIHPGATELCDGIDNNCSGTVDDGGGMQCALGSAPRACTTSCGSPGLRACNAACLLGTCVGTAEICNDCDDDGNGLVDDGLACRRGTSASCVTSCGTSGTRTCASDCSGYGACTAMFETCNDCDDNGNGMVDEGLPCRRGTSASCMTACGTTGSRVCAADCSGYGTCRATELCNGCDDDSDGVADNGFACRQGQTMSCTTPCGTAGVRTCAGDCSGYGACIATEVCNGCDDNANGVTDEGFACAQGSTSSCTTSCGTSGSRTCNATCSAYSTCSAAEVCNGCDDNANGMVDDGFVCAQGSSTSCTTSCGTAGSRACNATCTAYATCAAAEVCNGCDDDGVGGADNGFTCVQGASSSCTTSCGSPGTHICNGSCTGYGACSGTEVCNGCDDDGVGGADNGLTCVQGATTACTTACGTAGTHVCNGTCTGYNTCTAATETCGNGCDDNGNGMIDEGCGPANDQCAGAIALSMTGMGTSVTGTTVGSTNQAGCGSGGDVYYSFTLTQREVVYVDTEGSSYDTEVAFANGCTGNLSCNDDSCFGTRSQLVSVLNPGTYYVVVGGFGGSTGTFNLRFQHLPTGNATPIVLTRPATSGTVSGTTSGTGTLTATCGSAGGPEQMYYFTTCTYAGGAFSGSLCGATWDTQLYFRDATGGTETCNDDSCGLQSVVSGTVSGGAGLRAFYVDGYSTASGSYTLTYTVP